MMDDDDAQPTDLTTNKEESKSRKKRIVPLTLD